MTKLSCDYNTRISLSLSTAKCRLLAHTLTHPPDLDKTPTTPRVMKITEAEAYALKVRAANDTDAHVMTGVNMTTEQFESNINKSKDIVGEIVDEEIPASSPALPSEPWTFTEDQITGFRSNLSEILNSMARVTPRMATNPEAIAKELALF
ncbi:hypothetical protein AGABI1DRAFT_134815, partial [Agaricus bisporus var. burnettii JB137-S8]